MGGRVHDLPSPVPGVPAHLQPQLGPLSLNQPNQHGELGKVQSLPFSCPSQGQWDTCPRPCSQFSPLSESSMILPPRPPSNQVASGAEEEMGKFRSKPGALGQWFPAVAARESPPAAFKNRSAKMHPKPLRQNGDPSFLQLPEVSNPWPVSQSCGGSGHRDA